MRLGVLLIAILLAAAAPGQGRPIRGGDRLLVTCEQEPTLNRTVTLSKEGVGSFGILGAVEVGGQSPEDAARRLEALLLLKLSLERATVSIRILERDDLPIRFGGAVEVSGEIEATDGISLSDIVALAHPSPAADLSAVEIVRDDGSHIRADWGGRRENPLLRPGDRVFFHLATRPRDVFVLGGVYTPRNVPHDQASTVSLAISACGGLTPHANRRDITVERDGETVARIRLDADGGMPLQPGDTLRVGVIDERLFVTVQGAVRRPGRVAYFRGMGLRDVFAEVGGLALDADMERTVVRAGTGSIRAGDGRVFEPGFTFAAADRIEVPKCAPTSRSSLLWRILVAARRMAR
ncbi:MAG: SLBB domain-containing protein [Fimbriimonadaceae bacterium]|nr:SLBB domain-containing protein [Fimbriimonadaceae bacterium]